MSLIKNIDTLISHINLLYKKNNSVIVLNNLLDSYKGNDWKKYSKDSLSYHKEKIYNNNLYELYCITWMPGSESKIHDHASNGCLFKLLDGNLKENLYNTNTLDLIKTNYYVNQNNLYDTTQFINNNYYHKMFNISNYKAYSLHIYSPVDYDMNIFD